MNTINKNIFLLLALAACTAPENKYPQVAPPVASVEPFEITAKHGHTRLDDYYWLKDREDSAVIDYLKAENGYLDTMMAHTKGLQERLYNEMRSRIKEQDESVPYKLDDYYYYTRYVAGGEYPIYCRKRNSLDGVEEIMVDGNELGRDQGFLNFFTSISPDHRFVCIIMDTVGRNFYTIKVKDLQTGKTLPDKIHGVRSTVEWTNDNKSFYYCLPDTITLRSYLVKRHTLGLPSSGDKTIFEEKDETLSCYLSKTKSKKYIMIDSWRTDASYSQFIDADKPGEPKVIQPITNEVIYEVDHTGGDRFYVYTNLDAKNYRLVETPVAKPTKENWTDVIPHRTDIFLSGVDYFRDFLASEEMSAGLVKIRIAKWSDTTHHYIDFGEPAYYAGIGYNPDMNTSTIRYAYTSPTTPSSTFDYNMETREKKLMKEQEIPGGYDKTLYQTERVMVTAEDSMMVPLTIVYRKDRFKMDGTNPGWIYGYGSYGASMYPYFDSNLISMLDRGFVYALAHIRGGQEMGGQWYEDGKMMKKKNTFTDFIDCSEYLVNNRYVAKDKLFASGGSAGGLLMGAIANMRPDLYKGIVAAVPFVDIVTTMMDESIPLTTFEWKEWGNPNIQEEYEYMLSYSPYDNVEKKDYPNLLITTGLHDSQVQYWEPAKWAAKLRKMKTGDNLLLLHTNMDAGHGGASGRFESLKEVALEYVFMLDLAGVEE